MTHDGGDGRGHDAPPVAELERRMRPGAWDAEGFLAPGESLAERLAADARECARLGADPRDLGGRLLDLLAAGAGSDLGRPVRAGDVSVEMLRGRGFLTCPWAPEEFERCPHGPGGRATADRFTVTRGAATLRGYALSAHLIAAHGFFGGAASRFRVAPDAVVAVLGR